MRRRSQQELGELVGTSRESINKQIKTWEQEANAAGIDGSGLLQAYQARIDHYAKERAAKGYPWAR